MSITSKCHTAYDIRMTLRLKFPYTYSYQIISFRFPYQTTLTYRNVFILVINQLDAKYLFYNKFILCI